MRDVPILVHVPKCRGTTLIMPVTCDIFGTEGHERYAGRRIILWLEAAIAHFLPESAEPLEIDRKGPLQTVRTLVRRLFA